MHTTDFWVRKTQLATTVFHHPTSGLLPEGQVRVGIAKFALTSNNITYAAFGEAMNYWQFFPLPSTAEASDIEAWGRIPVWGFGTVLESRHPQLAVGERLYGYFPMSSSVDLTPDKISAGSFSDAVPHRALLHPVYNQYLRCATDPFYSVDTEDLQALLRPLFITSWLIDDYLADNDYFGAASNPLQKGIMLLSSASSKTAYGTAFQMCQRPDIEVVGLTSVGNVAFCESLGCYHRVLSYAQLGEIDPNATCVYVDFAGNAALRKAVHEHFVRLKYSSSIGGTHLSELGGGKDLPGPRPILFFAPAQIKKRNSEWGAQDLGQRLLKSWKAFVAAVADADSPWLRVQYHAGENAVQAAYLNVLSGKSDPRLGHLLSF